MEGGRREIHLMYLSTKILPAFSPELIVYALESIHNVQREIPRGDFPEEAP